MNHVTDIGVSLDELFYHFLLLSLCIRCGSSCNVMLLLPTAARSCRQPPSGIELYLKSTDFSDLLTSRSKLNRTASGASRSWREKSTSAMPSAMPHSVLMLPCCFAAATTAAAPSPRLFRSKLTEVNDLLKFRTIGTHEEKSGQSTVSIGRMHAKITSNERAASC